MTSAPLPGMPSMDVNPGIQPQPGPAVRPPLRRSSTDKMAGGVCGGLAEHTGIDSLLWRVAFVALAIPGGAGILVYVLLWVLMPPGPRPADQQPNQLDRVAEQLHDKVYSSGLLPPRG